MLKNRLDAYLVLGCDSFISDGGFRICHGVENPIIDLSTMSEDRYEDVIKFFDNACDLFSSQMNDYNKCVNTLSLLYKNYECYDKRMLQNIQSFLKLHKQCGIWLILIMKEDLK